MEQWKCQDCKYYDPLDCYCYKKYAEQSAESDACELFDLYKEDEGPAYSKY